GGGGGGGVRKWADLKIRVGYGVTGNQAISPYSAVSKYDPVPFVYNGNYVLGYALQALGNNRLRWESTEQVDVGIDIALPKNIVYFTIDWYEKKTRDLLQNVVLPSNTGFSNQLQNVGSIQNKGFEFTAGAHIFDAETFRWNIQANIFINKSKILSLGDKTQQFAGRVENVQNTQPFIQKVGEPNGSLYGYVEDGFYDSEEEVRADPAHKNDDAVTVRGLVGSIRFKDLDGEAGISDKDRTFIGDVNPKYSFGATNNFNYKNFDASVFISGVQGNDLINLNTYYMAPVGEPGAGNITQEMYDTRWTEENAANAKNPRPMASSGWHSAALKFSRRYVEDGSFVRLKNITLGYTIPFAKETFFKAVRFHVAINNLYTITKYSGYDPEVNSFGQDPSLRGVDLGAYPQAKTFLVGLKCTF
ncbi:MAG: SusC/RagA family TonB-linked outer membrane protein, partial [Candidatus Nephrothrix sp. EaCA]